LIIIEPYYNPSRSFREGRPLKIGKGRENPRYWELLPSRFCFRLFLAVVLNLLLIFHRFIFCSKLDVFRLVIGLFFHLGILLRLGMLIKGTSSRRQLLRAIVELFSFDQVGIQLLLSKDSSLCLQLWDLKLLPQFFFWGEGWSPLFHDSVFVDEGAEDEAAGGEFDFEPIAGTGGGEIFPINHLYKFQPFLS
jgi:hypothetical protein